MKGFETLISIFLIFFLLLNWPIISIFNLTGLVFGFPWLLIYLFSVWLILIVLTYFLVKKVR